MREEALAEEMAADDSAAAALLTPGPTGYDVDGELRTKAGQRMF